MFSPVVAICEKALVPQYLAPVVNETYGGWRRNAFRGVLVAIALAVSLAGSAQLNNFVALIGGRSDLFRDLLLISFMLDTRLQLFAAVGIDASPSAWETLSRGVALFLPCSSTCLRLSMCVSSCSLPVTVMFV